MARWQRRSAAPVALPVRRRPCVGQTMALIHDRATGLRSRSPGGGIASSTCRETARRWRACCRGSWAARPGIVGVLMAGGYSRQQCHCKFRPVRATAAGPGRSAAGTGEGEAECTRDAGAASLNLLGRARAVFGAIAMADCASQRPKFCVSKWPGQARP
jgi:hypothetical protein